MLKSMTGFGKATVELPTKKITIEIKSLNSKQFDVYLKIPNLFKSKELIVRNLLMKSLERGKIELFLHIEDFSEQTKNVINAPIVENYFTQLEKIADNLNIADRSILLEQALRLPDVLKTEKQEINEGEWQLIENAIITAISDLNAFRKQEGEVLQKDICGRVDLIKSKIPEIEKFEDVRIKDVKQRITDKLNEHITKENIDTNRFEQEIIYYLEKFDITEEKVRLKNHCNYFNKTVEENGSIGKKLGFISQEIGREINTIGSKANNTDMQKFVVEMKDELEKIKEQLLNVL